MFVSGHFVGNFESQLTRISLSVGVNGVAAAVKNLLLVAEMLKSGAVTHDSLKDEMFHNREYSALA